MLRIHRTPTPPSLAGDWNGPVWSRAETAEIGHFRPESSDHRPRTQARLLYDDRAIYGIFRVEDRYVRCVHTGYQAPVCRDSCVEFFIQPHGRGGYFNFEFNCGGSLLSNWITDWRRTPDAFEEYRPLDVEDLEKVQIFHSMPERVEPEIADPLVWTLEFAVPFEILAKYAGPLGDIPGQVWRGNLYKCGDETSHPHWAAWSPVDELNFHLPRCFGPMQFVR